ncbi:MAG: hypothetical protein WCG99_00690 [Candidatus Berkelbacteria bacterium]
MEFHFRPENRFWPVIWSSSEPLVRRLWTPEGVIETDCWAEARFESARFVVSTHFWQPELHRLYTYSSGNCNYRRNNPLVFYRALHFLAASAVTESAESSMVYCPDKLPEAAVYLAAHESYHQSHPLARYLLNDISDSRWGQVMQAAPPNILDVIQHLVSCEVPICRQSLDAELVAGALSQQVHENCLEAIGEKWQPEEFHNGNQQLSLIVAPEVDALHLNRPVRT